MGSWSISPPRRSLWALTLALFVTTAFCLVHQGLSLEDDSIVCLNFKTARTAESLVRCTKVWNSEWIKTHPLNLDVAGATCTDCKKIVTDVKKLIGENATAEAVEEVLDELCQPLPDYIQQYCMNFVHIHVQPLMSMIEADLDPTVICTAFKLCTNESVMTDALDKIIGSARLQMPEELAPSDRPAERFSWINRPQGNPFPMFTSHEYNRMVQDPSVMCDMCTAAQDKLKAMLNDSSSQEALKKMIKDDICPYLGSNSALCLALVDAEMPAIVSALENLDVCAVSGVCDSKFKAPVEFLPQCDICRVIGHVVLKFVKNHAGSPESAVLELCELLSIERSKCDEYISKYLPIVEALVSTGSVEAFCSALGMCPGVNRPEVDPLRPTFGSDKCADCESMQRLLNDRMKQPEFEVTAMKYIKDEVCPTMGPVKELCVKVAQDHIKVIIHILANIDFCKLTKVCPQAKHSWSNMLKEIGRKRHSSSGFCSGCEVIVQMVKDELESNDSADAVAMADKACGYLPEKYQYTCKAYCERFLPQVIKYIDQDLNPEEICREIGLCSDDSDFLESTVLRDFSKEELVRKLPTPKRVRGEEMCAGCQEVVGYIRDAIDSTKSKDASVIAQKACSYVPAKYEDVCVKYVTEYAQQVIALLDADIDPKEICRKMGFCSAVNFRFNKASRPPMECAKGPRYWCRSHANARKCDAMSYCSLTVWDRSAKPLEQLIRDAMRPELRRALSHVNSVTQRSCSVCVDVLSSLARQNSPVKFFDCLKYPDMEQYETCLKVVDSSMSRTVHTGRSVESICASRGFCKRVYSAPRSFSPVKPFESFRRSFLKKVFTEDPEERKLARCPRDSSKWCSSKSIASACRVTRLCEQNVWNKQSKVDATRCIEGKSFFCANLANAKVCDAVEFCAANVWTVKKEPASANLKPRRKILVGAKKCAWGPAYWCSSMEKAVECNAVPHCEMNVWKRRPLK